MRRPYYDLRVKGVQSASGAKLYEVIENERLGYIDALEYAKRPTDAIAELVHSNMFFNAGKRTKLNQLISEIEDFDPAPLFDRVGHNGIYFVYPDGTVMAPQGAQPANITFQPKVEKCHVAGTLEGWLSGVAQPLAGHPICEFFLMMPFAGPLRGHTSRVDNFGWELTGPKATAKSVLLQLMASTCGGSLGGEHGNFGLSFAATAAGIECEIQNYSDLAMIIDEGNLYELGQTPATRGRLLSQLFMSLGKGQEKRRYGVTGRTFRFLFATSANEMMRDKIFGTTASSVSEAVEDRIMTVSLAGRPFGVFDRLPDGYEDIGDFIADLIDASALHHGTAMRHYLTEMVALTARDLQKFKSRLNEHLAAFREEACVQANQGSARRVADAFGLVYAGARLAQHFGALPQTFNPLASVLACYRNHKALYRQEPSAAEAILSLFDDPEVVDLSARPLPAMSDKKLAKTKGFLRLNRGGQVELLIPNVRIHNQIPNWNQARRDDFELARMIRRDSDRRYTLKRQVRSNVASDRVVCFVRPT